MRKCEIYDWLCGSASGIEHTEHINIVNAMEILLCQLYCGFDNGDSSILTTHIKSTIRFQGNTWTVSYRNKTSNRAQLRVYRLKGFIYKLGIRNITFVCLRQNGSGNVLFLGRVFPATYKRTRTLAFILNSWATFSTTSGASVELLITSISEHLRNDNETNSWLVLTDI